MMGGRRGRGFQGVRTRCRVKRFALGLELAQALAGEFDTVDVMDQPVEDGVGEGWVADDVMPGVDGELAGDDCRGASVAVLEDLEQVAALGGGERREAPVVEDQQFGAGDGLEGAGVSAVASGERQRLEEARDAVV